MTWFKVDDKFWSHRKTRRLTDAAVALWVRAGSYCGDHLTDGVLEHADIEFLSADKATAEELVKAGLWLHHVKGYQFHDWEHYQPTKVKVERDREATRERVARSRNAKKNDPSSLPVPTRPSFGVTNGVSNGVTHTVTEVADPEHVAVHVAEIRKALGGH